MKKIEKPQRILWVENVGFLAIIFMSWVDDLDLFHYSHHIYGADLPFNWVETAVATVFVLLVWLLVHVSTRKLLARLHYLESYLKVCAWCRKIGHGDDWLSMEQFFSSELDIKTNHGICPECSRKLLPDETKSSSA